MKKRILVFPCGSEIGLEVHRSMRYSTHFELVGGSSVDDHGRFVFDQYVGDLPFHDAPDFAGRMQEIIRKHGIDAIYPTMDAVAETLQGLAADLPCRIIGSSAETTRTCASKTATYAALSDAIPTPASYSELSSVRAYPIFVKPDRGYGSRDSGRANDAASAAALIAKRPGHTMLIQEYLPGQEWTIDCFSDRKGTLRFHAARSRNRISNGISVNTAPNDTFTPLFQTWAEIINRRLRPRGAWFFQARQGADKQPRLLEVAARLAGSSALFRCQGVNFALLSAFDAFDQDVSITPNAYPIELDRALSNRYRVEVEYTHIYVDLDDCLLVRERINHQLVAFLYKAQGEGKRITLLTRHAGDPVSTLCRLRIRELFDHIEHITDGSPKSDHVFVTDAIFIDDSFSERADVAQRHGIPVFSPDMVECLI